MFKIVLNRPDKCRKWLVQDSHTISIKLVFIDCMLKLMEVVEGYNRARVATF